MYIYIYTYIYILHIHIYTHINTYIYIYITIFARAARALDPLRTHDLGHSPQDITPKTILARSWPSTRNKYERASKPSLLLLWGNSLNIVVENQWRNWTHLTARGDLSCKWTFDSRRFATIHFKAPPWLDAPGSSITTQTDMLVWHVTYFKE